MAALVVASSLHAGGKRVAIERDDLVGVWIGLTTDDLELLRLELSPEGDGVLGYVFVDEDPCVLLLQSWTFSTGTLDISLDEVPQCALGREFVGVVSGNTLDLTVRGTGWKRHAALKREAPLMSRWEALRAAMNDTAGEHQ